MTMVPAQNLSKAQLLCGGVGGSGYGGGCGGGGSYSENSIGHMSRLEGSSYECYSEACLGSDLVVIGQMAEDESTTNSINEAGSGSGSSSKDNIQEHKDEGWLQLSIGGGQYDHMAATSHDHQKVDQPPFDTNTPSRGGGNLVELDLLPGGTSISQQLRRPLIASPMFHVPAFRVPRPPVGNFGSGTSFSTSLLLQQQHQGGPNAYTFPHHQEINWAFRPSPQNIASSSSSSSSSLMSLGSYFARPFQLQPVPDVAGPSSNIRVVDAPRRPHSGIWFILQASQNQAKEPFLPQISKSYLRIKDGRMTVRLLIKYLVTKLKLDSESEIEITCRGQQLLPFLTLQHVRDTIWSPTRDLVTLLPHSSTTDHLMVLHYGRSA